MNGSASLSCHHNDIIFSLHFRQLLLFIGEENRNPYLPRRLPLHPCHECFGKEVGREAYFRVQCSGKADIFQVTYHKPAVRWISL
jgi:hypothetical protein